MYTDQLSPFKQKQETRYYSQPLSPKKYINTQNWLMIFTCSIAVTASLFIREKNCPSKKDLSYKSWPIYTVEFYMAIKNINVYADVYMYVYTNFFKVKHI